MRKGVEQRVGLYAPTYPGATPADGGIGRYTQTLGRALAELGHEPHVFLPGPFQGEADGPVRLHAVSGRPIRGLDRLMPGVGSAARLGLDLRKQCDRLGLNAIELPNYDGPALPILARGNRPLVVRLYTSGTEGAAIAGRPPNRWERWELRRERWLAQGADALVSHTRAHVAELAPALGIDPGRVAIVPIGVPGDPDWVRPPRVDGPLEVLFLGRMEPRKGAIDLLRAAPRIVSACPDVRFTLIGVDLPKAPGGRTHAQFVAEELPAAARERIRFAGRLEDAQVDEAMRRADLFVAPSLYESFGLIYVEAMRWGTPVVGTDAGGVPEVVRDGRTGLLVPPRDPDALADAVIGLLRDPDRRRAYGEEGRRWSLDHFSPKVMAGRMLELYREAAERRRGRGRGRP